MHECTFVKHQHIQKLTTSLFVDKIMSISTVDSIRYERVVLNLTLYADSKKKKKKKKKRRKNTMKWQTKRRLILGDC